MGCAVSQSQSSTVDPNEGGQVQSGGIARAATPPTTPHDGSQPQPASPAGVMSPQEEVIYVPLPPDPPSSRRSSSKFVEVDVLPGSSGGGGGGGVGAVSSGSRGKDSPKGQPDDSSIYPLRPSDQSNGTNSNSPAAAANAPNYGLGVK